MNNTEKFKIRDFIFLEFSLMFFSFAGVFLKLASFYPFFSFKFVSFYAVALFIMVIYAFFWQIILSKFKLTTAYANKGIGIMWTFVWGRLFFGEAITINMIIGAMLIITGVILLVTKNVELA